jgi:hypothetical protein
MVNVELDKGSSLKPRCNVNLLMNILQVNSLSAPNYLHGGQYIPFHNLTRRLLRNGSTRTSFVLFTAVKIGTKI